MSIFLKLNFLFGVAFTLLTTENLLAQQKSLLNETASDLIYLKPVENEKLLQYTINKIYPAQNGKLYLGTNKGLVCYDGLSVRAYFHIDGDTNSLSQNNVVDIVEDKKGNLYLSTMSGGINYLNINTGKFKHLSLFYNGPDIIKAIVGEEPFNGALYLDENENLWIGSKTQACLTYYNTKSGQNKQIEINQIGRSHFNVFDIKQDPRNKEILWLATDQGICSINKETFSVSRNFKPANISDSLPDFRIISCLDIREDGSIWFGSKDFGMGRYVINSGVYSFFRTSNKLSRLKAVGVTSLFKKNDIEYYVTLNDGSINSYNIIKETYELLPDQFLPKEFKESNDIVVDRYHNVWCIVNGRLYVFYADKNLFKTIAIKDKIYNNDSIPNTFQNILWNPAERQYYAAFLNSDEGIFILNDSLKVIKSIPIPTGRYAESWGATKVILDSKNRIWGCARHTLTVYDSNSIIIPEAASKWSFVNQKIYNLGREKMVLPSEKYKALSQVAPNLVGRCHDIISANGIIYVLTENHCLFINENTFDYKSIRFPMKYNSHSITGFGKCLRIDTKNSYLYASNYIYDSGKSIIFQYDLDRGSFNRLTIPSSIKAPLRYANYPWYELDDSGNIWVATSKMVFVYEPKTLKRMYAYEKNGSVDIKQLINIPGKGVMCILSESGIEAYDYRHDRSTTISVADGLYSNSFQIGGYANNMLFVSYPGYLQYVAIDSFLNRKENRFCYFSEITFTDKDGQLNSVFEFPKTIKLKYYQNDVTLTISTTEFDQPQRLQYHYMLEGADRDWVSSNFENRSITYRNLGPGTFTFRAAIKNSDGTWSTNELKLTIIIEPAFWQTLWFKFSCGLVILWFAYLFYQRRIKAIRSRDQQRARHEKELVELEAKALRAQMNPHFIFNCMNSIKSLMQEGSIDKGVTYLTTFSKLIRTLFNNADKKDISLYDEIETCKYYLQLEAMRFDAKFSYSVNIDENIDLKSILVPALIIQPFIENAIWHGIVPRGSGGNVSLNVVHKEGNIEISIDDDGIGRETSAKNRSTSNLTHQSKGVNLTQTRLELNNLLQQRQAILETIDKKDEQGNSTGTTVIIKIKEELS